jgi:exo-rhamnogalacturonan lyase-like protein
MYSKSTIFALFFIFLTLNCFAENNLMVKDVRYKNPFTPLNTQQNVYSTHIEKAPILDGKLDDECWKKAQTASGFVEFQVTGNPPVPKGQTKVFFVHTKDVMYIGAYCEASSAEEIKQAANADDHDKNAYNDDCLDMVFKLGWAMCQFVVGSGGARIDFRAGDKSWNPDWKVATSVNGDHWVAEIALPFKNINFPNYGPKPGYAILFNVGRASAPKRFISSLFPGYNNVDTMGMLVFGTPLERMAYLEKYPGFKIGEMRMLLDKWVYDDIDEASYGRVRLSGVNRCPVRYSDATSFYPTVTVLSKDRSKTVSSQQLGVMKGKVMDFDLNLKILTSGEYVVKIEITDSKGKSIKICECPLVIEKSPQTPTNGEIPINIDIPAQIAEHISKQNPLPVYAGVPLPRGSVYENSAITLYDKKGRTIPCQANILAKWSPNGSSKWLGVHFQLESSETREAVLRFEKTNKKQSEFQKQIKTTDDKDSINIDTGTLKLEFLKKKFDGIHQAWMDLNGNGKYDSGESLFDTKKVKAPYVVDHHGNVFSSDLDENPDLRIEEKGPLYTVLRVSGWYVSKEKSRICQYIMRFYIYAGLSWIKINHTFIFSADSRKVKLADIGLPFGLKKCSAIYRFGAIPKDIQLNVTSKSAVLLQHEKDVFDITQNGIILATGKHAPGWIETRNNHATLAVGIKDFWQNFPKELEAEKGGITAHIWPRHGIDKPRKPLTDDNVSELWFVHHRKHLDFQAPEWFSNFKGKYEEKDYRYLRCSSLKNGMGVARSTKLFLNFRKLKKNNTAIIKEYVNKPAFAATSSKWMCDSGVFGPMEEADPLNFPVIEESLEARFDGERSIERFSIGMWNYGGSNTYFKHFAETYDQVGRPWRLTHHGGPRVPWLMLARTGKRKYFDYGVKNSLRCADIGFCHYSTPEMERQGYYGKIRGALCDYKGLVPWSAGARLMDYNSMADFLHYFYYFTSNRWPFEVSQEWGNITKKLYREGYGRAGAGTLDTLLSMYEATWDMDYRELAEREFINLAEKRLTENGYFRISGTWYDYAPWLSHYHRMTGSKKAEDAAKRWMGRFLRDHWTDNQMYGAIGDTCFVSGMGYPVYDILRVAYEGSGNREFLDLALGCARVVGISVFQKKDSLAYGMDLYSRHSAGGYYQQTVPYILPILKKHQNQIRALFPRWLISGKKLRFFINDSGGKPLELRVRFKNKEIPDLEIITAKGKIIKKSWDKMQSEVRCKATTGIKSTVDYVKIVLTPEMLASPLQLIFTSKTKTPFSMFMPVQSDRPVKMIYAWDKDLVFARGSAIYFKTPATGGKVAIRALGQQTMAQSLALLDRRDEIVALKQWYTPEEPGWVKIEAAVPPGEQGKVWCCLQGLSRSLSLEMLSKNIPLYFADRPERFFLLPGM